VLMIF